MFRKIIEDFDDNIDNSRRPLNGSDYGWLVEPYFEPEDFLGDKATQKKKAEFWTKEFRKASKLTNNDLYGWSQTEGLLIFKDLSSYYVAQEISDMLQSIENNYQPEPMDLGEKIIKKNSKYQVQSEKGKNLGTYSTKKEAEKRLKDVEMFKHLKEDNNDELSSSIFKEDKLYELIMDMKSREYNPCLLSHIQNYLEEEIGWQEAAVPLDESYIYEDYIKDSYKKELLELPYDVRGDRFLSDITREIQRVALLMQSDVIDLSEAATKKSKIVLSADGKEIIRRESYQKLSGHLDIPDGVEVIPENCFEKCDKITSIHLPSSLMTIGSRAFVACDSLKSIDIPGSVKKIWESAFAWCKSLESINIPDSVEKIEDNLFVGCSFLESINIPDSVNYIGPGAFRFCLSLESINIPESVEEIGKEAFDWCNGLKTIICHTPEIYDNLTKQQELGELPKTVSIILDTGEVDLSEDIKTTSKLILSADGKEVLPRSSYEDDLSGHLDIPEGIERIADICFSYCRKITSIHLPDSIKEIGEYAFSCCNSLRSINLPEAITKIGDFAFDSCDALETVTCHTSKIYDNLIGQQELKHLPGRTEIIYIGEEVDLSESFQHPSGLVLTNDGKKVIRRFSYQNISGHLDIPDGVEVIPESCFEKCTQLISIHLPDSVKQIGNYAFLGCKSLKSIDIPDSIEEIGRSAFVGCESLKSINIPDSVEKIEDSLFARCKSLESINLPESVKIIGWDAFVGCESLESINIPKSVIQLMDAAFNECDNLKIIICHTPEMYNNLIVEQKSHYLPEETEIILDTGEVDLGESVDPKTLPEDIEKHETLNPALWTDKDELKPEVKDTIIKIVDKFADNLQEDGVDINIADIVLLGSNASYNYTKDSDIDIHILADEKIDCDEKHLPIIYNAYKQLFNNKYEIKINGFDVEIYVEDVDKVTNISNGVYSVVQDKWLKKPEQLKIPDLDKEAFDKEFKKWEDRYLALIDDLNLNNADLSEDIKHPSGLVLSDDGKEISDRYLYEHLSGHIDIPDGVEIIPTLCFEHCDRITSIHLPDSVKEIGKGAFRFCSSLKSINIPDSIEDIPYATFFGCDSLKSINLPASVKRIGQSAFNTCSLESITIPDSIKVIDDRAFAYCGALESVTILSLEPFETLGQDIFYKCDSLELIKCETREVHDQILNEIKIPEKAEIIIDDEVDLSESFQHPSGLVLTNDGKKVIKRVEYRDIAGHLDIPDGVEIIGKNAFESCGKITSIHLPDSVKKIEEHAFEWCTGLRSINFPSNLESIGELAFQYCEKLESISIPNSVKSIGEAAFSCCRLLKSVDLPDSLKDLEKFTFNYCSSLKSIELPETLDSIGNSCFAQCYDLQSIDIPNNVKFLGNSCFRNTLLDTIIIPASVTNIENYVFNGCDLLKIIICRDQAIHDKLIEDQKKGHLPEETEIILEGEEVDLSESIKHPSGLMLTNDGKKIIRRKSYQKLSGHLDIPDGVEVIPAQCFGSCTALTSIHFPDSVKEIGFRAFAYCRNLSSINIPESVKKIGGGAFAYCRNLSSINIPKSVDWIYNAAFLNCTSLRSIHLPKSLKTIDTAAFEGCMSLESVDIPESVKHIGKSAFAYCYSLQFVDIPNSLKTIEYDAFESCDKLDTILCHDPEVYNILAMQLDLPKNTEIMLVGEEIDLSEAKKKRKHKKISNMSIYPVLGVGGPLFPEKEISGDIINNDSQSIESSSEGSMTEAKHNKEGDNMKEGFDKNTATAAEIVFDIMNSLAAEDSLSLDNVLEIIKADAYEGISEGDAKGIYDKFIHMFRGSSNEKK